MLASPAGCGLARRDEAALPRLARSALRASTSLGGDAPAAGARGGSSIESSPTELERSAAIWWSTNGSIDAIMRAMDDTLWPTAFSWLGTVALAVVLAAAAGLRAWLPLLVAGVVSRLGVADLGASFTWLGSWPALGLLAVATVIEIAGDKIPVVDHALDAVGTFIRPLTGALAAAAALVHIQDPVIALVVGLVVGAPVALAPHVAKTTLRGVSTGTTAGLANPFLSLLEDIVSFFIAMLGFLAPLVALLLVLSAVWFSWRWLRRRRSVAAPS
jgi:hypothetical protein